MWTHCGFRTPARGPRGHLRAQLPRVRAGAAGQPGGGRHAGAHEPDARRARGGEAVLYTVLYAILSAVLYTVQVARLRDIAQPRLVITDDGLLPVLAEAATMTATKVTLYHLHSDKADSEIQTRPCICLLYTSPSPRD